MFKSHVIFIDARYKVTYRTDHQQLTPELQYKLSTLAS